MYLYVHVEGSQGGVPLNHLFAIFLECIDDAIDYELDRNFLLFGNWKLNRSQFTSFVKIESLHLKESTGRRRHNRVTSRSSTLPGLLSI